MNEKSKRIIVKSNRVLKRLAKRKTFATLSGLCPFRRETQEQAGFLIFFLFYFPTQTKGTRDKTLNRTRSLNERKPGYLNRN